MGALAHVQFKVVDREDVFGSRKVKLEKQGAIQVSKKSALREKINIKHYDQVLIDENLFSNIR